MSSKAIDRARRMLALLAYLNDKDAPVSFETAAKDLDISSSEVLTLAQNLAMWCSLPGQSGGDYIDIDIDISGASLRLINAQGLDRPLRLTADEGMALTVAARSLSSIPGVAAPEVLESAIEVLERAAAPGQDASVAVGIAAPSAEGLKPEVMDALSEAIRDGQALRIVHLSGARDEVTERVLDPVSVLRRGANSYLRAWCRRAAAMRTFRTDRIISASVLSEPAVVPVVDFDPDFQAAPSAPDLPKTVVVLAPSRHWQADYLPHLQREDLPDGSVRLVILLTDDDWAKRLVMAGGGEVRLPEREDLEARAAEAARVALKSYLSD